MNKRIFTLITVLSISIQINAKSGTKWSTGGNGISTGDFLGTTNNEPLLLKANNNLGLKIKPNGEIIFKSLDLNSITGSNGIVFTDGQGKIGRINFTGSTNHILLGDGSWGTIPSSSNLWLETNGNISYTHGYVGIGTSSPLFPLDVIGDARISNNLYVGGGIVITDKVRATGDVKTGRLEADTINMGVSKVIVGETKVEGDTKLKFKLDVSGASTFNDFALFNQQVNMQSNFNSFGQSYFANDVQLNRGFTFDGVTGIKYLAAISNTPSIISLGGTPNPIVAKVASTCAAPYGNTTQAPGIFQVFEGDVNNQYVPGGSILNLQSWAGGSSIDATSTTANTGGLLINYFCGNNTFINTGANGGKVSMGKNVEIGLPVTDLSTALNINLLSGATNAIKISNPALTSSSKVIFEVKNNGQVFIGTRHPNFAHSDALLGVDGKALFTSVYINQLSWADYVFKPNYKLPDLKDVEAYYLKNQHLPEIPSEKEIVENGMNVGDISVLLLKKIEELTIYTVDLNKQIKKLQEQNSDLQKKMNNLNK